MKEQEEKTKAEAQKKQDDHIAEKRKQAAIAKRNADLVSAASKEKAEGEAEETAKQKKEGKSKDAPPQKITVNCKCNSA